MKYLLYYHNLPKKQISKNYIYKRILKDMADKGGPQVSLSTKVKTKLITLVWHYVLFRRDVI